MSQLQEITTNIKDRVSAVQLISAKKSNIPLDTEKDDKKRKIMKWGKKNEYPYYLNYLVEKNTIHGGIVRAKKRFIVSGGLIYEGPDQEGFEKFFKNKKIGQKGFNLEEIISDIALGFEISNLQVYRIVFNFVGSERTYKKIEVIPFEKVRYEIEYNDENQVEQTGNIHISEDWFNDKLDVEVLSPYNPNDPEQKECFVLSKEESGQSLVDYKGNNINPGFYPSPLYSGAIVDIDTLIQVGIHGNSEIHNGFSLGTMIYLANGKPKNDKDKKDLERDLTDSTTGGLQAGRSMVVYGNGQDQKPEILSLQGNNLPDRYINTKKGAIDSIVHAHQCVVPTLFGIKQEGSFNASELEVGYAIMEENYFADRRKSILTLINFIMNDIAEVEGSLSFAKIALNLDNQVASDDASRTGQALNDMSPLVATKVLSSMSPNEIRSLAKLPPMDGGDALPEQKESSFSDSDHDKIMKRFKKFGVDKSQILELHSATFEDYSEAQEDSFLNEFQKSAFQELDDNTQRALELIQQNQGFDNIRKALDVTSVELARIYQNLIAKELINSDGQVTQEGRKQIAVNDVTSLQIMYEYRLRPDAPELVAGGESREFCQVLIGLNRLYTREDIAQISGVEGYNVFAYRGGWYHNPNSGKNEPGCRHEWAQVVTFK